MYTDYDYKKNLIKAKWHAFFSGFRMSLPVQFLFYQENGLNFTEMSFLTSALFAGMFLFDLPSGIFADHYGRKKSLAMGNILIIASFILFLAGSSFTIFAIAIFLAGMGESFLSGSDEAFIYDSLKELNKQGEFNRYFGQRWGFYLFGFGASALASVVVIPYGVRATFLWSIPFSVAAFWIAVSMKEPPLFNRQYDKAFWQHLKVAIRYLLKHPRLRSLIVYSVAMGMTTHIFFQYIQFFLTDAGINRFYFGFIYAGFIMIASTAAIFAHRIEETLGERRTLLLIAAMLVASMISISISQHMIILFATIFSIEFTFGMMKPVISQYFHDHVDSHNRSTVASVRTFAVSLSIVIFAPMFGYIADSIGYAKMMGFLAIFLILCSLPYFRGARRNRAD